MPATCLEGGSPHGPKGEPPSATHEPRFAYPQTDPGSRRLCASQPWLSLWPCSSISRSRGAAVCTTTTIREAPRSGRTHAWEPRL
jgi:hypothetical protein